MVEKSKNVRKKNNEKMENCERKTMKNGKLGKSEKNSR